MRLCPRERERRFGMHKRHKGFILVPAASHAYEHVSFLSTSTCANTRILPNPNDRTDTGGNDATYERGEPSIALIHLDNTSRRLPPFSLRIEM